MNSSPTILIAGAGLAGQLSALALAQAGFAVTLVAPKLPQVQPGDPYGTARTTAFLSGSVAFLKSLDIWSSIAPYAAPLEVMQLIDPAGRGEVAFQGSDAADPINGAFGLNVPNRALGNALAEQIARRANITLVEAELIGLDRSGSGVVVRLAGHPPLAARLLVACDGARSTVRHLCRIPVKHKDYKQFALTYVVGHKRPHGNVSTEFHYATGPMTLVPLPGDRSSIVHVCGADDGRARLSWSPERLAAELAERAQGHLGAAEDISIIAGPGGFPIHGVLAESLTDRRVALVGEAAHAMPPIGAQGLNSTLLDIAWLTDSLRGARDPGDPSVLRAYDARRKSDIAVRFAAIDGLNRAVLSTSTRLATLRGQATGFVGRKETLQQALMAFGMIGRNRFPQLA